MGDNTNKNPKGNNNEQDWERVESLTSKATTKKIDAEDANKIRNPFVDDLDDCEVIEEDSILDDINDRDLGEVVALTAYQDGSVSQRGGEFIVAEYNEVDIKVEVKHQIAAKNIVSKITKFILDFNDVALTDAHKSYIKQVANLQVAHFAELSYLVDVNKQMINNIIHRVNATQGEDYAIVNQYTMLVNQHLKLIKELQTNYRAIPTVIKKMKADVLCNQELDAPSGEALDTDAIGVTNSARQVLDKIMEKRKQKEQENKENKSN